MKLSDICIVTKNVKLLADFYEKVLELQSEGDEVHSSITIGNEGIAMISISQFS